MRLPCSRNLIDGAMRAHNVGVTITKMGNVMAQRGIFFTGAGGFLGRFLLPHYLNRADTELFLLENGPFCARLRGFVEASVPDEKLRARVRILEGDITRPGLGLAAPLLDELKGRVTHAVHLAALYNLSAPRDISVRVNVDGTRNVLDFLGTLSNLQKFAHTSTLAVAGKYTGVFTEDDFDKGQSFKNFYEETKFLSEKLVRERRDSIPTVILRPSVVVGHSKTGEIEKIDGPYYTFVTIARHLQVVMPDCGPVKCHIAPVDFVMNAYHALFEDESSAGQVYYLMDPNPLTYNAFFDLACEEWGRMKPLIKLPAKYMKPLFKLGAVEKLAGIPWEAYLYGDQAIEYDIAKSTAALARNGIACPPLPSYIGTLIHYFQEHYHDTGIRRDKWWEKKQ